MVEIGKSYGEIEIGNTSTFSKTVTETDIFMTAGLTGDFNPIHVNEEYAASTMFETRVAHGSITLGLSAPIIGMQLPGPGSVLLELQTRFHKPVHIGDTVTATGEVIDKIEKNRFIKMDLKFTNQNDILVAEGNATVLPPKND